LSPNLTELSTNIRANAWEDSYRRQRNQEREQRIFNQILARFFLV
jgi:hypothetical protein